MRTLKNVFDFLLGPRELIHRYATPQFLQFVRWGVFSLWIVKLGLDPLWRLSVLPPSIFNPIGLLSWLTDAQRAALFSSTGLTILWVATLLSALVTFWPRGFFISAPIAAIFLTIYSSVIRAYGTSFHTDLSLLYSTYALAGFALADALTPRKERPQVWNAFPLVTLVVILILTYTLVALNRFIAGGWDVFFGSTMEIWTVDASLRAYYFNTGLGWHVPEIPGAALTLQIGLFVTTVVELLAPLCLFSARFRWFFIPYMLIFHALSLVFLNIFFFDNMLLFLLLVDWTNPSPAPIPPAIRNFFTALISPKLHDASRAPSS